MCAITPLVLVLGNIMPSIGPFKLHWYFNGITLLSIFISMALYIKKWIYPAILLAIFIVLNIAFSIRLNIGETINTLGGPILFSYFILLLKNECLLRGQDKILYIFIACSLIPLIIALFQFLNIIPLTIFAFTFINETKVNGIIVQRPNGFLFHASELANIAYFLFAIIIVKMPRKYFFLFFIIFFIFQLILVIKSAIGGFILLSFYLLIAPIKFSKNLNRFLIVTSTLLISGIYLIFNDVINEALVAQFLSSKNEMIFNPDIFTGRGRMWTIFLIAIYHHFDLMHYLFGGGFGVSTYLFELGMEKTSVLWVYKYIPHPHNELLNTFINGGVVLMSLYYFLFKRAIKVLSTFNTTYYSFIPILLIVFITAGLTVPIFDRFIFWICVSFLFITLKEKSTNIESKHFVFSRTK